MALEIVRRIRGNGNESIDISELENAVLEHPFVQRLRRIKQLAFLHYVFPGATHTRFEHSLGVLHLSGVAWKRLQDNQSRLYRALVRYGDYAAIERKGHKDALVHGLLAPSFNLIEPIFSSDYLFQTLRLAALLHDLGHPPFSHSGERFLPSWQSVASGLDAAPSYLRDYVGAKIEALKGDGGDPSKQRVRHEIFSMLMIARVLDDTYRRYPKLALKPDPRDVIALIGGPAPLETSPLKQLNALDFMRELISGELDIDRMDYLIRDSRECGVVYGIFDAGRILDSLCLYYDPSDHKLHAAISFSGLAAFEDYLRARHSMYLQLYFHKTAVAAEAMMQHLAERLRGWELPADVDGYAAVDEYNVCDVLRAEARGMLPAQEAAEVERLVSDLINDRCLWKRIFEISGRGALHEAEPTLERAEAFLTAQGQVHNSIFSGTSLTRFRPRGHNELSRNYLRVVKKDEQQFPRVVPIEDLSPLIAAGDRSYIYRIYAPSDHSTAGGPRSHSIRDELVAHLRDEP